MKYANIWSACLLGGRLIAKSETIAGAIGSSQISPEPSTSAISNRVDFWDKVARRHIRPDWEYTMRIRA